MTHVITIFVLVKNEVLVMLVDRIVRQVHTAFFDVRVVWGFVLLRGKSRQALLIHEDPQREHTGHQNIYTKVKLQVVNQIGVFDVPLNNVLLPHRDIFRLPYEVDSSTLSASLRFYDICVVLAFFPELVS
jgi:hypothetical protein